jgi:hypothetical protein
MHFLKRILKCVKCIFKMHFQLYGNSNSFTEAYINLKAKINLKFNITIRKKTVKSQTGLATIYYNGENIFNQ